MADKNLNPLDLPELSSAPASPSAGFHRFYSKTDGKAYSKNSSGVEYDLTGGGGGGIDTLTTTGTSGAATLVGTTLNIPVYQSALTNPVTGTGTSGQVAYWNGTTTQTGSSNLFWDNTNGRLGVGLNTGLTASTHIRGAGATSSTTALLVQNSTPSTLMSILNNGNVGIGTNSPVANFEVFSDRNLLTYGDGIIIKGFSNIDYYRSVLGFYRSRGTIGSPSTTQNNDVIGSFSFFGYATTYKQTATIRSVQTANSTGGATLPGNIEFYTADGSTESVKATITSAGNFLIGNTDGTARLQIRGSGTTSATTALLVQNSTPTELFKVLDNGNANFNNDLTVSGVFRETVTANRQAASYTLALTDRGKLVEMDVATANNLTVPLNSSIAFPVGTKIDIVQYGAGQTTIVATGGVTLRSTNNWLKINARYGAVTLVKIATDEWYVFGNLNA